MRSEKMRVEVPNADLQLTLSSSAGREKEVQGNLMREEEEEEEEEVLCSLGTEEEEETVKHKVVD